MRVEQTKEAREDKRSLAHTEPEVFVYVLAALAMGNNKLAIAKHLDVDRGAIYRIEREYCEEIGEWKGLCYREMEVLSSIARDRLKEALLKYQVPENVNARDLKELAAANHFINEIRVRVAEDAGTAEKVEEERKYTAEDILGLRKGLEKLMEESKNKAGNQVIDVDFTEDIDD